MQVTSREKLEQLIISISKYDNAPYFSEKWIDEIEVIVEQAIAKGKILTKEQTT